MCGIGGFFGEFDPALLERMNGAQAHRGPDDHGTLFDPLGPVGLAHRRLAIIDLSSRARQPMHDAEESAAIVYNGELYNYRELRRELMSQGQRFRTESDTEVVLSLYLRYGYEMLPKMNGIYAFAIWDRRSRALFIARDGLGVKPLYYAELPAGVVFASELKALLEAEGLSRQLDPIALHSYLGYLWCPAPRTLLRAVQKLRPGWALLVREGRVVRRWRHYEVPWGRSKALRRSVEAVEAVEGAVRRAVVRQMVADVPVGVLFSGGLDSTAVAWFAARSEPAYELQAFTIGFTHGTFASEGFQDDLPYARRYARELGLKLHSIEVGPEMMEHLQTAVYHLDEPQADPAAIHVLLISGLARQNGIKVLLSGTGGDDLFAGYRRHRAAVREQFLQQTPRALRALFERLRWLVPAHTPAGRRLHKFLRGLPESGDRRLATYYLWTDPETQRGLYAPGLAGELENEDVLAPLLRTLGELRDVDHPLDRMLHVELKHFLGDHNLPYMDKMGMAHGVEIRVPLLDLEVVEVAAQIPPELKVRRGVGKWVFLKAMEPHVPREILHRSKTGFGAPLRLWLKGPLRPLLEELLSPAAVRARGLFDPAAVERLRASELQGQADHAYLLFALMCVEIWCRLFLDRPRPRTA